MDEADLLSISREIRMLLPMVMKMSVRALEQYLSEQNIGINRLHFGILVTLQHRHFTLSELSKLFSLDPSTLVPVIDSLEQKGLVERGRDPKDRRRIPLHLTERGSSLLSAVPHVHKDDLLAQSLKQLGDEKAVQLRDRLRELANAMQEDQSVLCEMREHLGFAASKPQLEDHEIV
jgi:DNA-binding MarR family transcriptional regulator